MTHTPLLTPTDAVSALQEVIEGNEDFVYERVPNDTKPACAYERGGEPSCVVGHVLFRRGWTLDELAVFDEAGDVEQLYTNDLIPTAELSWVAMKILGIAQRVQDSGDTWGQALAAARTAATAIQEVE